MPTLKTQKTDDTTPEQATDAAPSDPNVRSDAGVTKPSEVTAGESEVPKVEKAKDASDNAVFSDCGTTEPTVVTRGGPV